MGAGSVSAPIPGRSRAAVDVVDVLESSSAASSRRRQAPPEGSDQVAPQPPHPSKPPGPPGPPPAGQRALPHRRDLHQEGGEMSRPREPR
eukprot:763642-Hanusia_phi.AAC.3